MDQDQIDEIRNMLRPAKEGPEAATSAEDSDPSKSEPAVEPDLETLVQKQFGSILQDGLPELQRTNSGRLKKRRWSERTFSRMEKGSLRGSIFTLINTAMGLGMLAMPQCVGQIGIVLSVIFFISTAVIVTWSLDALNYCSHALGGSQSYADAVRKLTGKKFALFFAFFLIESIIVSTVALVVASANFIGSSFAYIIPQTLDYLYTDGIVSATTQKWWSFALIRFALCVSTGWLSFFRDLTSLRYLTVVGFVLLLYLIVVLVVQTPEYYNHNKNDLDIRWIFFENTYDGWSQTALAFLKFIFAYNCHIPLINVRDELNDLTFKRMKKVTDRSVEIMALSYIVICTAGILTCGSKAPALIFARPALNPDSDYFMQFGLFLFAWYMMFRVPQRLMISRQIMIAFINGPKKKPSFGLFFFMTLVNVLLVTVLAVFLSDIQSLINLISSLNGTFVIVTCPGILLLCALPWKSCKTATEKGVFIFNLFVTTVVSIMGLIGTGITIYSYF